MIKIKLRRRDLGDISFLDETDIPHILKKIYVQRGICKVEELDRSTKSLLHYRKLIDIDKSVDLLVNALVKKYKLMIVGDCDVDGATSTALMILALRRMGAKKIDFIIPNRFNNDYGLSTNVVELAEQRGAKMIITVDNGISSYAGVTLAHQKQIIVLISDHHIPSDKLPDADAIVNPNLRNCVFESKYLSGVGVAFYIMLALRARLHELGWFLKNSIVIPKLSELLDLVALGTVADVVPLDYNNRILVHQGLSRIRAGYCRPGIRALAEISNIKISNVYESDIGFSIGPRINAAGRLNDMSIGVSILLTNNLSKARILAIKLNHLNKMRQKIEKRMENEALILCKKIEQDKKNMPFGLAIYHSKWHQGVVGTLASRIKDRFYRPVIAFAPVGNDILKGSGRSITGVHIHNVLEQLDKLYPGMILKFGGHAMAAGLMLKITQLDRFKRHFDLLVNKCVNNTVIENIMWSDGELENKDISLSTAEIIRKGGPWGQDFQSPVFDGQFKVLKQYLVKEKHLILLLQNLYGGPILNGIAFNVNLDLLPDKSVSKIEIAYKLEINDFKTKRHLQLLIQHIWIL